MNGIASQLIGVGHYAPERRIDNLELENRFNLASGWIERRTGIISRRWAGGNETLVDMAEKAGLAALDNAGISRKDIALTILATSTPDHLLPPTAPLLAHRLDLSKSGAFDLSGACTGFLHALMLADGFVRVHGKSVLVVAANILSRRINHAAYESAVLFADAAGATVLAPSTDTTKGLLGVALESDGSGYDLISIAAGGSQRPFSPEIPAHEYKMNMKDGQAIFTQAVKMMVRCSKDAMENAGIAHSQISRFVPHQANLRMTENIANKLGIIPEKTISTISEYGNSSAASIPLSLSISHLNKAFVTGEKILLAAAGAGLTGGAIVLGF